MRRLSVNTVLLMTVLSIQAVPVLAKSEWKGCDSVTEIPASECEALIALYNSTNGQKWKKSSGWLQTNTLCSWHGISCREGNVTRISLEENQLNGSIPAALGNLSELQDISLRNNQLTGSIPSELGNLSELKRFYLGDNRLSGNIPPELGKLSAVQELHLGSNRLGGEIPPELGNLSSLQILHLSNNRLNGSIPATFGNLSSAKTIWMGDNRLSGEIPPELGNIQPLWSLVLDNNRLSGSIPSTFGNLSDLETLWLCKNQLSGVIPLELGKLSSLKSLLLNDNRVSGSIPPELGNLSSIETIVLSSNQLSGAIPPEFGRLSTLKDLSLDNNRLTGPIPAALGNLSSLERLSLGNNKLRGEIPREMGNLSSLKRISTHNNELNNNTSWTLTVNSSGIEVSYAPTIGVPITANPSKYSGHTNYSASNIASGTLIHLKAPAATGIWPWKKRLVSWNGCDFMFGRTCAVKMLANKTVTANYDPDAKNLPSSCDSMEIVLENPEKLNVRYTVMKHDPIARSGESVGNKDGLLIPESVTVTSRAEEMRAVEWRSMADTPIYIVIITEKCDGSTMRHVHPVGLGGMIQEDSTSFLDMKSRITVKVTSSLSDADKNDLRTN